MDIITDRDATRQNTEIIDSYVVADRHLVRIIEARFTADEDMGPHRFEPQLCQFF